MSRPFALHEKLGFGLLVLLLGVGAGVARASLSQTDQLAQPLLAQDRIVLLDPTGHRLAAYQVELAKTPTEVEHGLMYRETMPLDHGMLFFFEPPRDVSFWMKNTPMSLDLLFLRADGVVARVVERARPFDTTPIPSLGPAAMVLELNAGEAARRNLAPGAVLQKDTQPIVKSLTNAVVPSQAAPAAAAILPNLGLVPTQDQRGE